MKQNAHASGRPRSAAVNAYGDFDALREHLHAVRRHTLDHLDVYLDRYLEAATENGNRVHFAETPEELNRTVEAICRQHGARRIIKGKSMVTEESALNDHLTGAGFAVQQGGLAGAYLFAAAVAAMLALLVAQYPETPVLRHHHDRSLPPLVIAPRAVVVVLMGVAFVSFSGLGFAFMFTLALGHGLGYDSAGRSIGLLLLLSASGCLAGGARRALPGNRGPRGSPGQGCGVSVHICPHNAST